FAATDLLARDRVLGVWFWTSFSPPTRRGQPDPDRYVFLSRNHLDLDRLRFLHPARLGEISGCASVEWGHHLVSIRCSLCETGTLWLCVGTAAGYCFWILNCQHEEKRLGPDGVARV